MPTAPQGTPDAILQGMDGKSTTGGRDIERASTPEDPRREASAYMLLRGKFPARWHLLRVRAASRGES